jgi:hypothetical protein
MATSATALAQERVEVYDGTARTLDKGTVRLGLFSFDYGITHRIAVGIDVPAWVTRTFSDVLAPNVHLKVALFELGPVSFTGQAAGYYVTLSGGEGKGQVTLVPLSLFASAKILPRVFLHGEGTYTYAEGTGSVDIGRAEVANGTVGTRSGQAGLMIELRLTRWLALLGRGRYQFYERPLVVRGGSNLDPYTRVDVNAEAASKYAHPYLVTASLAFTWTHVGFTVGGGFGQYTVPGSNLVIPYRGLIPEAQLVVQF